MRTIRNLQRPPHVPAAFHSQPAGDFGRTPASAWPALLAPAAAPSGCAHAAPHTVCAAAPRPAPAEASALHAAAPKDQQTDTSVQLTD